jgi:hypothetical protein
MNELSTEAGDVRWKSFYKFAAITALLIVLVGLMDITVSSLGGEARENSAIGVVEWFTLFQTNRFAALGNLGLFNILTLSLGIPLFLALFNVHRQTHALFGALAVILFAMGTAIYISSNTVFSMSALSDQYAVAADAQKPLLEAAGRALLARGADLTPGTFMGFLFTQSAGMMMAFILLRGGMFGKVTAWLGVAGFGIMLVFFTVAAFVPAQFTAAIMISAPGGLALMAYHILLARRLFQLAGSDRR